MEQMEFNLLDEPWIRVMTEDCTVVERSLMQVLLNSHQYQRLAGELPTQDVALLRLLLAILQTVFYRVDPEGEDDPIEDRAAAIGAGRRCGTPVVSRCSRFGRTWRHGRITSGFSIRSIRFIKSRLRRWGRNSKRQN